MNKEDLKIAIEKHQLWLNDEDGGERANLERADLRGAYLEGANLERANLRGAYLERAYLERADLRGADLRGAYLRGANLEGAYLEGANLEGAYLEGADLEGADLEGASLWGAAGNRAEIKSIFAAEQYPITYTAEYLQIGCERHLIDDWWAFDDDKILSMDGKKAMEFWMDWKATIQSIIAKSPATKTGHEESAES